MNKEEYLKQIDDVIEKGPFKDTWESLSHYEVPEWYRNAKFGIFIHWGVYSVPAFDSEWYSRNMYIEGSRANEHHVKTYGSLDKFSYKDFIPMFRAEKFNADEWAELFKESGAQYVIPVAEHHDGFQMYKSEVSHWNAYEMGPKKDILGELSKSVNARGMQLGASSHRIEHWFFMHGARKVWDVTENDIEWPAMPERPHFDKNSEPAPDKAHLEDWLIRCCEIVDRYSPKVLYFDWWIIHSAAAPYLRKFAAYYYNRAAERGTGAVINYKHDSFAFGSAVPDVERGQFPSPQPYIWQTDTSVARNSWCYTEGNDYKTPNEIICDLIDIVSKNGRMLLNIGSKSDGTIPDEDRNILNTIGSWLKVNGEGIYSSKPWRVSGEGPTKIEGGQFTDSKKKEFTSEDIRFTANNGYVYAYFLNPPADGHAVIRSMAQNIENAHSSVFYGNITEIIELATGRAIEFKQDENGLYIDLTADYNGLPGAVKIKMK